MPVHSESDFTRELRELLPHRVDNTQSSALWQHYCLLQKWNRAVSLTSVTDFREIVRRHYAESILAADFVPRGTLTLADIGSGPGFPGFPTAVMRPEVKVTLVESVQKKAAFLREASDLVPNLSVLSARAENLGMHFDVITARAVRPQDVLRLIPSVAPSFVLLLGSSAAQELLGDPSLQCDVPTRIPWSDQTVIVRGRCVLA